MLWNDFRHRINANGVLERSFYYLLFAEITLINKAWQEVSYKTMKSARRTLWPEEINEMDVEAVPRVDNIVSVGKSVDLHVSDKDVEERDTKKSWPLRICRNLRKRNARLRWPHSLQAYSINQGNLCQTDGRQKLCKKVPSQQSSSEP